MIYQQTPFKKLMLGLGLLCVLLLGSKASLGQRFSENEVRAAFIFKLSKFIKWPSSDSNNLVFCSTGETSGGDDKSVSDAFNLLSSNKENMFKVIKDIPLTRINECNILYIDNSASNNLKDILSQTSGRPVVTVSDIKSFTNRGGMFGFIRDSDGRIKMELSKRNAESSNISINPSLLEIIKIVD